MTMEVMTDADLILHIAAGREEALVELHRRYAAYLAAVARRIVNSHDVAGQCVQDTFVKVWDNAERFDLDKASAKTWMVTICRRIAINRIRGESLDTMPLQNWDAPVKQPDHLERIHIEQALSKLDGEELELIKLAFFQGHSHGQVAKVTGKPLGTVKSKLRGAIIKLRDILKGGEAHE